MNKRFFQYGVRQLLLLFAVLSLLLGIMAPQLQRAYVSRQLERTSRNLADAKKRLDRAVVNNDVKAAQKALAAGANPNPIVEQHSLLHRSIERGQIAMIELLLDSGADVQRVARLPRSAFVSHGPPLFAAISCDQPTEVRLEMVRLLVKHGADAHTQYSGRSAMDLAIYRSDPEIADLLKELGLPYGPREMAAFNRLEELRRVVEKDPDVLLARYRSVYAARPGQGPTVLGLALERGHRQMAQFLVESGASLDTVEGLGQTPLHMAARGGDPELIRLLVAHGLDVHARDEYQDTPLTDSVWRIPPDAITALIEAGSDIDARGINGRTALHLAVRAVWRLPEEGEAFSERLEVIRILLTAGADPSIPDRNGETAADWAQDNSPKVAELLAESIQP